MPISKKTLEMQAYERQKRWVLSTQRHVHIKAHEIDIKDHESTLEGQALESLGSLRRRSNLWSLSDSVASTLFTSLDYFETCVMSFKKRDEESQRLLRELGTLVRQQKRRIADSQSELGQQQRNSEPTSHNVAQNKTASIISALASSSKTVNVTTQTIASSRTTELPLTADATTPSRAVPVRPIPAQLASCACSCSSSSTSANSSNTNFSTTASLLQLQAEQEAVQFWKRRCQTKDTLILRLQGIVNEQKVMLARDSSERQTQHYRRRRGHGSNDDDDDGDDDETKDYRASRRKKSHTASRNSHRNRSNSSSSSNSSNNSHHRRRRRRRDENEGNSSPSRVLLDLPSGVFGNVELNLSWPPSTSSIDSADEDDEETESRDLPLLPSIVEDEEEQDKEEQDSSGSIMLASQDIETKADNGKVHEEGDESSDTSSLEVSRSLQSDDSGMLFERYL